MKSNYHPVRLMLLVLTLSQTTNSLATEAIFNQAGGALSSTQLVSAVLAANPQLEVVQAIWQATASRIEQESALDDPMLVHSMAPQTIGNQQNGFSQST